MITTSKSRCFLAGRFVIRASAFHRLDLADVYQAFFRHARSSCSHRGGFHPTNRRASYKTRCRFMTTHLDRHGTAFWLLTEADLSRTTVMLAGEPLPAARKPRRHPPRSQHESPAGEGGRTAGRDAVQVSGSRPSQEPEPHPEGVAADPIQTEALFPLGTVVMSSGALKQIEPADADACLQRHAVGDWGEAGAHDRGDNDRGLREGGQLVSVHRDRNGITFWIITDANRTRTTVLLPVDY